MYLKTDKIVATIGNVVMRSFRTGVGNEFILDPTAVVGWTDGVNVRRDATPRLGAPGDFSEKGEMSSRQISFSGTALSTSVSGLHSMRDTLLGLLADGSYGTLKMETGAGTRYSTVGLEGSTSWVQHRDTAASWKIDFYAPDPFIYGEKRVVQTGAYVTYGGLKFPLQYPLNYNIQGEDKTIPIRNSGNVAAWPTFTAVGDFVVGFSVTDNLGNLVTYNGMVSSAAPVSIDMARGTATQLGVDKTHLVSNRKWFSIPAGQTISPAFRPIQSGPGWCDIIYRDTWI